SLASAARTCSRTSTTLTVSCRRPKSMKTVSPGFTSVPALAGLPLICTRPASQTSFASVRRLMIRDTFRNLSIRMKTAPYTKTGPRCRVRPNRLGLSALLQLLARAEGRHLARRNLDRLTGLGVATRTGSPVANLKRAEADERDLASLLQCRLDGLHNRLQ